MPSDLRSGKIKEDLIPGTYKIFIQTSSGKSNSEYITLTKPVELPALPKGKEILPTDSVIAPIPISTTPKR